MHSLFTYFGNKLLLEDKELFSRGVDEVFAHSVLMSVSTEGDPLLVEQVKEHLQANGLQVRQEVISKVTFVVFFCWYLLLLFSFCAMFELLEAYIF